MGKRSYEADKAASSGYRKETSTICHSKGNNCVTVCKEIRDLRHLLDNSVCKLFWSRLTSLAWYSYRYMWSLFNSFFVSFSACHEAQMLRYCPKLKFSQEKLKRLHSAIFAGVPDFGVFFFFQFSGAAFFQFLCRKKCCISTFLTYFCCSFIILLHSPAVLSICISVVRGVKANRGTGPNDKLIGIKIVIFFPSCTENELTGCVEIKSKEGVYTFLHFM